MHRFQWIKAPATPPPAPDPFALTHVYSGVVNMTSPFIYLDGATFSGVPIGADDATRELFIVMAARKYGSGDNQIFASCNVAGYACQMLDGFRGATGGFDACLRAARITNPPGGLTTADIAIALSSSNGYAIMIDVYRAVNRVGYNTGVADFRQLSDGLASTHTISGIVQPDDGFTLVAGINNGDFADPTSLSAGWTKDAQVVGSNYGNSTCVFGHNVGGALGSATFSLTVGNRHQKTGAWSFYG